MIDDSDGTTTTLPEGWNKTIWKVSQYKRGYQAKNNIGHNVQVRHVMGKEMAHNVSSFDDIMADFPLTKIETEGHLMNVTAEGVQPKFYYKHGYAITLQRGPDNMCLNVCDAIFSDTELRSGTLIRNSAIDDVCPITKSDGAGHYVLATNRWATIDLRARQVEYMPNASHPKHREVYGPYIGSKEDVATMKQNNGQPNPEATSFNAYVHHFTDTGVIVVSECADGVEIAKHVLDFGHLIYWANVEHNAPISTLMSMIITCMICVVVSAPPANTGVKHGGNNCGPEPSGTELMGCSSTNKWYTLPNDYTKWPPYNRLNSKAKEAHEAFYASKRWQQKGTANHIPKEGGGAVRYNPKKLEDAEEPKEHQATTPKISAAGTASIDQEEKLAILVDRLNNATIIAMMQEVSSLSPTHREVLEELRKTEAVLNGTLDKTIMQISALTRVFTTPLQYEGAPNLFNLGEKTLKAHLKQAGKNKITYTEMKHLFKVIDEVLPTIDVEKMKGIPPSIRDDITKATGAIDKLVKLHEQQEADCEEHLKKMMVVIKSINIHLAELSSQHERLVILFEDLTRAVAVVSRMATLMKGWQETEKRLMQGDEIPIDEQSYDQLVYTDKRLASDITAIEEKVKQLSAILDDVMMGDASNAEIKSMSLLSKTVAEHNGEIALPLNIKCASAVTAVDNTRYVQYKEQNGGTLSAFKHGSVFDCTGSLKMKHCIIDALANAVIFPRNLYCQKCEEEAVYVQSADIVLHCGLDEKVVNDKPDGPSVSHYIHIISVTQLTLWITILGVAIVIIDTRGVSVCVCFLIVAFSFDIVSGECILDAHTYYAKEMAKKEQFNVYRVTGNFHKGNCFHFGNETAEVQFIEQNIQYEKIGNNYMLDFHHSIATEYGCRGGRGKGVWDEKMPNTPGVGCVSQQFKTHAYNAMWSGTSCGLDGDVYFSTWVTLCNNVSATVFRKKPSTMKQHMRIKIFTMSAARELDTYNTNSMGNISFIGMRYTEMEIPEYIVHAKGHLIPVTEMDFLSIGTSRMSQTQSGITVNQEGGEITVTKKTPAFWKKYVEGEVGNLTQQYGNGTKFDTNSLTLTTRGILASGTIEVRHVVSFTKDSWCKRTQIKSVSSIQGVGGNYKPTIITITLDNPTLSCKIQVSCKYCSDASPIWVVQRDKHTYDKHVLCGLLIPSNCTIVWQNGNTDFSTKDMFRNPTLEINQLVTTVRAHIDTALDVSGIGKIVHQGWDKVVDFVSKFGYDLTKIWKTIISGFFILIAVRMWTMNNKIIAVLLLAGAALPFVKAQECAVWHADKEGMQVPKLLEQHGYASVIHGVWNLPSKGSFPCDRKKTCQWLQEHKQLDFFSIAPETFGSPCGSVIHEYCKHGAHFGYTQEEYFIKVTSLCYRVHCPHTCRFNGTVNVLQQTAGLVATDLTGCVENKVYDYAKGGYVLPTHCFTSGTGQPFSTSFLLIMSLALLMWGQHEAFIVLLSPFLPSFAYALASILSGAIEQGHIIREMIACRPDTVTKICDYSMMILMVVHTIITGWPSVLIVLLSHNLDSIKYFWIFWTTGKHIIPETKSSWLSIKVASVWWAPTKPKSDYVVEVTDKRVNDQNQQKIKLLQHSEGKTLLSNLLEHSKIFKKNKDYVNINYNGLFWYHKVRGHVVAPRHAIVPDVKCYTKRDMLSTTRCNKIHMQSMKAVLKQVHCRKGNSGRLWLDNGKVRMHQGIYGHKIVDCWFKVPKRDSCRYPLSCHSDEPKPLNFVYPKQKTEAMVKAAEKRALFSSLLTQKPDAGNKDIPSLASTSGQQKRRPKKFTAGRPAVVKEITYGESKTKETVFLHNGYVTKAFGKGSEMIEAPKHKPADFGKQAQNIYHREKNNFLCNSLTKVFNEAKVSVKVWNPSQKDAIRLTSYNVLQVTIGEDKLIAELVAKWFKVAIKDARATLPKNVTTFYGKVAWLNDLLKERDRNLVETLKNKEKRVSLQQHAAGDEYDALLDDVEYEQASEGDEEDVLIDRDGHILPQTEENADDWTRQLVMYMHAQINPDKKIIYLRKDTDLEFELSFFISGCKKEKLMMKIPETDCKGVHQMFDIKLDPTYNIDNRHAHFWQFTKYLLGLEDWESTKPSLVNYTFVKSFLSDLGFSYRTDQLERYREEPTNVHLYNTYSTDLVCNRTDGDMTKLKQLCIQRKTKPGVIPSYPMHNKGTDVPFLAETWITASNYTYILKFDSMKGWGYISHGVLRSCAHVLGKGDVVLGYRSSDYGKTLSNYENSIDYKFTLKQTLYREVNLGDSVQYDAILEPTPMEAPHGSGIYFVVNPETQTFMTLQYVAEIASPHNPEQKVHTFKHVVIEDGLVRVIPVVPKVFKGWSGLPILNSNAIPVATWGTCRSYKSESGETMLAEDTVVAAPTRITPRDEMSTVVSQMMSCALGKCIARLSAPTGYGKSTTFVLNLCKHQGANVILMVPTVAQANSVFNYVSSLVNRTDALRASVQVVLKVGGQEARKSHDHHSANTITYATYGYILHHWNEVQPTDYLIMDEVHSRNDSDVLAMETVVMLNKRFVNTLAMTATVFTHPLYSDVRIGVQHTPKIINKTLSKTKEQAGTNPVPIRVSESVTWFFPDSERAEGKNVIIFNSGIEQAKEQAKVIRAAGLNAEAVYSGVTIKDSYENTFICATDALEASVTIAGTQHVIDFQKTYKPVAIMSANKEHITYHMHYENISIDYNSQIQRRGRTGRDCNGVYWSTGTETLRPIETFPEAASIEAAFKILMTHDDLSIQPFTESENGVITKMGILNPVSFVRANWGLAKVDDDITAEVLEHRMKMKYASHIPGAEVLVYVMKYLNEEMIKATYQEIVTDQQYIDSVRYLQTHIINNNDWIKFSTHQHFDFRHPLLDAVDKDGETTRLEDIQEKVSTYYTKQQRPTTFSGAWVAALSFSGCVAALAVLLRQWYIESMGEKHPSAIYPIKHEPIGVTLSQLNYADAAYWNDDPESPWGKIRSALNHTKEWFYKIIKRMIDSLPDSRFRDWLKSFEAQVETYSAKDNINIFWEKVVVYIKNLQDNPDAQRIAFSYGATAVLPLSGIMIDSLVGSFGEFPTTIMLTALSTIASMTLNPFMYGGMAIATLIGYVIKNQLTRPLENFGSNLMAVLAVGPVISKFVIPAALPAAVIPILSAAPVVQVSNYLFPTVSTSGVSVGFQLAQQLFGCFEKHYQNSYSDILSRYLSLSFTAYSATNIGLTGWMAAAITATVAVCVRYARRVNLRRDQDRKWMIRSTKEIFESIQHDTATEIKSTDRMIRTIYSIVISFVGACVSPVNIPVTVYKCLVYYMFTTQGTTMDSVDLCEMVAETMVQHPAVIIMTTTFSLWRNVNRSDNAGAVFFDDKNWLDNVKQGYSDFMTGLFNLYTDSKFSNLLERLCRTVLGVCYDAYMWLANIASKIGEWVKTTITDTVKCALIDTVFPATFTAWLTKQKPIKNAQYKINTQSRATIHRMAAKFGLESLAKQMVRNNRWGEQSEIAEPSDSFMGARMLNMALRFGIAANSTPVYAIVARFTPGAKPAMYSTDPETAISDYLDLVHPQIVASPDRFIDTNILGDKLIGNIFTCLSHAKNTKYMSLVSKDGNWFHFVASNGSRANVISNIVKTVNGARGSTFKDALTKNVWQKISERSGRLFPEMCIGKPPTMYANSVCWNQLIPAVARSFIPESVEQARMLFEAMCTVTPADKVLYANVGHKQIIALYNHLNIKKGYSFSKPCGQICDPHAVRLILENFDKTTNVETHDLAACPMTIYQTFSDIQPVAYGIFKVDKEHQNMSTLALMLRKPNNVRQHAVWLSLITGRSAYVQTEKGDWIWNAVEGQCCACYTLHFVGGYKQYTCSQCEPECVIVQHIENTRYCPVSYNINTERWASKLYDGKAEGDVTLPMRPIFARRYNKIDPVEQFSELLDRKKLEELHQSVYEAKNELELQESYGLTYFRFTDEDPNAETRYKEICLPIHLAEVLRIPNYEFSNLDLSINTSAHINLDWEKLILAGGSKDPTNYILINHDDFTWFHLRSWQASILKSMPTLPAKFTVVKEPTYADLTMPIYLSRGLAAESKLKAAALDKLTDAIIWTDALPSLGEDLKKSYAEKCKEMRAKCTTIVLQKAVNYMLDMLEKQHQEDLIKPDCERMPDRINTHIEEFDVKLSCEWNEDEAKKLSDSTFYEGLTDDTYYDTLTADPQYRPTKSYKCYSYLVKDQNDLVRIRLNRINGKELGDGLGKRFVKSKNTQKSDVVYLDTETSNAKEKGKLVSSPRERQDSEPRLSLLDRLKTKMLSRSIEFATAVMAEKTEKAATTAVKKIVTEAVVHVASTTPQASTSQPTTFSNKSRFQLMKESLRTGSKKDVTYSQLATSLQKLGGRQAGATNQMVDSTATSHMLLKERISTIQADSKLECGVINFDNLQIRKCLVGSYQDSKYNQDSFINSSALQEERAYNKMSVGYPIRPINETDVTMDQPVHTMNQLQKLVYDARIHNNQKYDMVKRLGCIDMPNTKDYGVLSRAYFKAALLDRDTAVLSNATTTIDLSCGAGGMCQYITNASTSKRPMVLVNTLNLPGAVKPALDILTKPLKGTVTSVPCRESNDIRSHHVYNHCAAYAKSRDIDLIIFDGGERCENLHKEDCWIDDARPLVGGNRAAKAKTVARALPYYVDLLRNGGNAVVMFNGFGPHVREAAKELLSKFRQFLIWRAPSTPAIEREWYLICLGRRSKNYVGPKQLGENFDKALNLATAQWYRKLHEWKSRTHNLNKPTNWPVEGSDYVQIARATSGEKKNLLQQLVEKTKNIMYAKVKVPVTTYNGLRVYRSSFPETTGYWTFHKTKNTDVSGQKVTIYDINESATLRIKANTIKVSKAIDVTAPFEVFGETFDFKLDQRIFKVKESITDAGYRIYEPTDLFENVPEIGRVSFAQGFSRERHHASHLASDLAYNVYGMTPANSVVGHTQDTEQFKLASWKKRLDLTCHEPSKMDAQLLLASQLEHYTPEYWQIANGREQQKFKPWTFDEAAQHIHRQGKGGHFDTHLNFGAAIEDPAFRKAVEIRMKQLALGAAVPTYITYRAKPETKAKKIQNEDGRIVLDPKYKVKLDQDDEPCCDPDILKSEEYHPTHPATKRLSGRKQKDRRERAVKQMREASNIMTRGIQLSEFIGRFTDLMILGPVQQFHNHVAKLYMGSTTGTPLWQLGDLMKAVHDAYIPFAQQEFMCASEKKRAVRTQLRRDWILNNQHVYQGRDKLGHTRFDDLILCGDFSGYDGTISKTDIALNYLTYKRIYQSRYHPLLKNRFEHMMRSIVITDHGHIIVTDGQRKSGDQDTSFGNTEINDIYHGAAVATALGITCKEAHEPIGYIDYNVGFKKHSGYETWAAGFKRFYLRRITHIADGDDNVHFGAMHDLRKLDQDGSKFLERCGKKIRCGERSGYLQVGKFEDVEFCSHRFIRTRIGRISIPDSRLPPQLKSQHKDTPIDALDHTLRPPALHDWKPTDNNLWGEERTAAAKDTMHCAREMFKDITPDVVLASASKASLPYQHSFDVQCGLTPRYLPRRPFSQIIGKYTYTMKNAVTKMDYIRLYGQERAEIRRALLNERAHEITRGKALSYALNYPHLKLVRLLTGASLAVIGDGACDLKELSKRYNVPSTWESVHSGLKSVFGVQTIHEIESVSPDLERKELRVMRYNTQFEYPDCHIPGKGKICPVDLGNAYRYHHHWVCDFGERYGVTPDMRFIEEHEPQQSLSSKLLYSELNKLRQPAVKTEILTESEIRAVLTSKAALHRKKAMFSAENNKSTKSSFFSSLLTILTLGCIGTHSSSMTKQAPTDDPPKLSKFGSFLQRALPTGSFLSGGKGFAVKPHPGKHKSFIPYTEAITTTHNCVFFMNADGSCTKRVAHIIGKQRLQWIKDQKPVPGSCITISGVNNNWYICFLKRNVSARATRPDINTLLKVLGDKLYEMRRQTKRTTALSPQLKIELYKSKLDICFITQSFRVDRWSVQDLLTHPSLKFVKDTITYTKV